MFWGEDWGKEALTFSESFPWRLSDWTLGFPSEPETKQCQNVSINQRHWVAPQLQWLLLACNVTLVLLPRTCLEAMQVSEGLNMRLQTNVLKIQPVNYVKHDHLRKKKPLRNNLQSSFMYETSWPLTDLLGTLHGISSIADVVMLESHHGLYLQHCCVEKSVVHAVIHSVGNMEHQDQQHACDTEGNQKDGYWNNDHVTCSCLEEIRKYPVLFFLPVSSTVRVCQCLFCRAAFLLAVGTDLRASASANT